MIVSLMTKQYVNKDWVLNILAHFNTAYKNVIEKSQKTPMEYVLSKGNFFIIPSRIYFHLVENKDNDEFPFAFLATYTAIENGKLIAILDYSLAGAILEQGEDFIYYEVEAKNG